MGSKNFALGLCFLGGFAALSWQVLWQLDLTLALGVSAKGTALTVATVMAGMTTGALWIGRRLDKWEGVNPWVLYGILELSVGLSGSLPHWLGPFVENVDAGVYREFPFLATPFSLVALALTIGPSSFAMGATLPVIGLIAERTGLALSRFYAVNTAGAAFGAVAVAFWMMPNLGRSSSAALLVAAQLFIFFAAWRLSKTKAEASVVKAEIEGGSAEGPMISPQAATKLALATGFAAFALEIAWFRMLRAAWLSTTDSFAIMLAVFLIALAVGAWLSQSLRHKGIPLGLLLFAAAVAVWMGTPLIERFDLWGTAAGGYSLRAGIRVFVAMAVMGPAVILLGVALPWLLDEAKTPQAWSRVYAMNTIGAVMGSLSAAWLFMALLGPAKTSWIAGFVLAAAGIVLVRPQALKLSLTASVLVLLLFGWWADSGIGIKRVQGPTALLRKEHRLLKTVNGPDVTTSVVQTGEGANVLFIDGYAATGEFGSNSAYMDAMGRLPMLLHTAPKEALVICFGTGQTARAVLEENPDELTLVDVNPAVFELAGFFQSNRGVLDDDRVETVSMDGRAWLRRTRGRYDVVTLEPMPPFFAGTNSLYSVEFYELIDQRLRQDGFAAQWFPMHLMTPAHAHAVAAAFVKIFPHSILWVDPSNSDSMGIPQQGILIGRKGDTPWDRWPGFDRFIEDGRPLDFETVNSSIFLTAEQLGHYVEGSEPVTDDNQILSYGRDSLHRHNLAKRRFSSENVTEIQELKARLADGGR